MDKKSLPSAFCCVVGKCEDDRCNATHIWLLDEKHEAFATATYDRAEIPLLVADLCIASSWSAKDLIAALAKAIN